nr:hypothetical protein Iba_chr06bCG12150 [Ipomoea batatas]GME12206.1 hypothetical protein Iba_scaffold13492CG0260 [Ipomoea batatas]
MYFRIFIFRIQSPLSSPPLQITVFTQSVATAVRRRSLSGLSPSVRLAPSTLDQSTLSSQPQSPLLPRRLLHQAPSQSVCPLSKLQRVNNL